MKSIRRYLLVSLIVALTVGSLLVSTFVYLNATGEINELYDASMEAFATTLESQLKALGLDDATAHGAVGSSLNEKIIKEQEFLIQIWDEHHAPLYTSHRAIPLPLQDERGHFFTEYQGRPWRVYVTESPDFIIQIAQPEKARVIFTRQMALRLLLPMLGMIPVVGLFIWLAVGRSLYPLNVVSNAIQKRSAASLEPLPNDKIPLEIKPMVGELNALLLRLKDSLEAQKRFTADAAHELRTPLTALKLRTGIIRRTEDAAKRAEAVDQLDAGIDRATHVVHQLLTLARLEPEAVEAKLVPVDLAASAREVIAQFAEQAHQRYIDLGAVALETATVSAVPENIRIIMENLIDNALRYTPRGGKVNVSVCSAGPDAFFEVEDNGIGIPEKERARVFERFHRLLGTETQGTGLGLAITKTIIERFDGTIRIGSGINGSGTKFTVRIPLLQTNT